MERRITGRTRLETTQHVGGSWVLEGVDLDEALTCGA